MHRRLSQETFPALLCVLLTGGAVAQTASEAPVRTLGTVTVQGPRPTSLPAYIPTTIEGVSGKQVEETVNATDSEDALKYLPSLVVRKRYIGDFDHAVIASRASGTGNSARSLVYADGILLSNLLGNGASYTPRWALVTPEEIERVDVLYGPFSAAYSGNSVGAVVDYVTRMPRRFEAHAKVSAFSQRFKLFGTDDRYDGHQASASVGSRNGDLAWWVNVNRLENQGHPMTFATRTLSSRSTPATGTPVTGAVADTTPAGTPRWVLGAGTLVHTVQDHAKLKLGYDISRTLRASYTFGWWLNHGVREAQSYLRDATGNAMYSGTVAIEGQDYPLAPTDFEIGRARFEHQMHGVSLKSSTQGTWDWEVAASLYDYTRDKFRAAAGVLPASAAGGPGAIVDMGGTGWNTFAVRGTWRPDGLEGDHLVDIGLQQESFKLNLRVSATPDWISGDSVMLLSAFGGRTRLQSVYLQDTWRISQDWRATLGARAERWAAFDGRITDDTGMTLSFVDRQETSVSPKAALAFQVTPEWVLKGSLGRAVRHPTAAELFQGTVVAGSIVNNDPNLRPEKSWTTELTAERDLGNGLLRGTLFHEATRDALYSQRNVAAGATVNTVQNVDRVRTTGLELALQATDVLPRLDLTASLTYADSRTVRNPNFPASEGKRQPRVPQWRGNLVGTYRPSDAWSVTLGARYSGTQFNTLDNSDLVGTTYGGTSSYFVVDARVRWRIDKQWSAAAGVDNLNNENYWAFHPYAQRTLVGELKFDL